MAFPSTNTCGCFLLSAVEGTSVGASVEPTQLEQATITPAGPLLQCDPSATLSQGQGHPAEVISSLVPFYPLAIFFFSRLWEQECPCTSEFVPLVGQGPALLMLGLPKVRECHCRGQLRVKACLRGRAVGAAWLGCTNMVFKYLFLVATS